jgi:hypothetical protein
MMTGVTLAAKAVGCEEEEGEEGYVNLAKGEHSFWNNNGWRTPDDSLLELEAANDILHGRGRQHGRGLSCPLRRLAPMEITSQWKEKVIGWARRQCSCWPRRGDWRGKESRSRGGG